MIYPNFVLLLARFRSQNVSVALSVVINLFRIIYF